MKREKAQVVGGSGGRFVKKTGVNLLVTAVFGIVYFYFRLPAINLQDESFYFFFFSLSACYCVVATITSGLWRSKEKGEFFSSVKNHCKVPLYICAALLILIAVGSLLSSVLFRARAYSELITVEDGDFQRDVEELSFDQIPMLDRDSAEKLGDRKLGELSDMVSQFEVSEDYTQINYNDRPVRVTPLRYGDFIKWLNNRSEGLPAYILIDMVTQNVEVVRLDEGMKYSEDEYFFRNLERHLRFNYPTFIFDTPTFEIDENGNPYWICPRIVKTIGLFGGSDIRGAVLVDAVTGETQYYEEVPSWVDRVYSAELIIEQYDYHGKYLNGFFNAMFGQRGVTVTTAGYNYIAINDDVYMYTGITSAGGDQSNVGFILSNQRTKETYYYPIAGAEEFSAMSSAEGVVQHLGYTATFPLLLNISDQPTYFMALKDAAELVKMYAMVNVSQYQIVATGTSVAECESNYIQLLAQNNIEVGGGNTTGTGSGSASGTASGVIEEIRSAVIDGNTYFYFRLSGYDGYFSVSAADSELCVIASVGDTVSLNFVGSTAAGDIAAASSFTLESVSGQSASDGADSTGSTDSGGNDESQDTGNDSGE